MLVVDNENIELKICPLCASSSIKKLGPITYASPLKFSTIDIHLKAIPSLYECSNCFSWFTNKPIPENQAIDLYTSGDGNKRWSPLDFENDKDSHVVKYFKKILSPELNVLDVGCNTGEFLDYAKNIGCYTYGVELSQSSLTTAIQKGHQCADHIEKLGPVKFDIITAFDVIEHLYHPKMFIQELLHHLKPNGSLIILTGNKSSLPAKMLKNNWWYCRYPEHVIFPDEHFFIKELDLKIKDKINCYASKTRESQWISRMINALKFKNDLGFGYDHTLFILSL